MGNAPSVDGNIGITCGIVMAVIAAIMIAQTGHVHGWANCKLLTTTFGNKKR
jgi:high-affinity Fe2+/Pb2+ permease